MFILGVLRHGSTDVSPAVIAGCSGCSPGKEKCREAQNHRGDRGGSAKSRGGCSSGLRRSGLRARQQLQGPERRGGEVSSSGPDGERAWLQVGAGALKHCVASGCLPEATLLLEAIREPEAPLSIYSWESGLKLRCSITSDLPNGVLATRRTSPHPSPTRPTSRKNALLRRKTTAAAPSSLTCNPCRRGAGWSRRCIERTCRRLSQPIPHSPRRVA